MTEETTLQRKLRERAEAQAAAESAAKAEQEKFAEFVPEDTKSELSDEDKRMDQFIELIDITRAYKKWCGKGDPVVRAGQTESIKVRCPFPWHTDNNPSASLNVEKDVFMCHGTCNKGGDKYDIAAVYFGFDLGSYKNGENFHKLRRAMAESMGYAFIRQPGKTEYAIEEPKELDETYDETADQFYEHEDQKPAEQTLSPAQLATVTPILGDEEDDDDDSYFYKQAILVDYEKFIKPDTFLDVWMKTLKVDDAPDDYHFWHGMLALGMAAGRDVKLVDPKGDIFGNLNVCLVGPSGSGKSRSKRHLDALWDGTGFHFDPSAERPKGVKIIKGPGSGEMLIKYFEHICYPDPTQPKVAELSPVKGLIDFNEFSTIMAIVSRRGSVMEQALMSIYDCEKLVASASLTTGEKKAKEPFGSVITTVQPKSLKRLVNEAALQSGFANRFLFASGLPKETDEFGDYNPDITPTFTPYGYVQTWCQSNSHAGGIGISLTDDAKAYGNEFFKKHVIPAEKTDDSGLLKRIRLTMKKMILLNAINERCEGVTPEMLERTFSILPYLLRTAGASGSHIGESKDSEIVRAILEAAARFEKDNPGKGITLREVRRMYQTKKFEIADVNKALENLVKIGELEKLEAQKGPGRPTIRYRVAQ